MTDKLLIINDLSSNPIASNHEIPILRFSINKSNIPQQTSDII